MRRYTAILLTASLTLTVMGGISPTMAQPAQEDIGRYSQFWAEHDLTANHVEAVPGGIEINGPAFTNSLRVYTEYLEQEVGAWGADRAFTPGNGTADFSGRKAVFTPLEIGEQPIFTWGDASQIALLERPMWLTAQQQEYGASITLTFDDGDTAGQSVYVSKTWLWARGIPRPSAVHEDGTELVVNATEDGAGFVIDVHHFSTVEINPPGLTVLGRQGGLVFPHVGEKRWYPEALRLEIDVSNKLTGYSVLVDKAWVDFQIPNPALVPHTWVEELYQGAWYYGVSLLSSQTPVTLTFREFLPNIGQIFGKGSPESVWFSEPILFQVIDALGNVTVHYILGSALGASAHVNLTYLSALNFTSLAVQNGIQSVSSWNYRGASIYFRIAAGQPSFVLSESGIHVGKLPEVWPSSLFESKSLEDLCQSVLGVTGIRHLKTWTGDVSGSSIAEIYVYEKRFCFAWDLIKPTALKEKLYMASYGVVGNDISCGNGTESSEDTEQTRSRKEAALCSLVGDGYWGQTQHVQVSFVGAFVEHIPNNSWKIWRSAFICAAGITVAGASGGSAAVFAIAAMGSCIDFVMTVAGELRRVIVEDKNVGYQLITQNWQAIWVGYTLNANILDTQSRRATTWQEVEQAIPTHLRPTDWYGYQRIVWTVWWVDNAIASYTPDVSILRVWDHDHTKIAITHEPSSASNMLGWKAKKHDIGNSWVETKFATIMGLDWETPYSSVCASITAINAGTGSLGINSGLTQLPCPQGLYNIVAPTLLDLPWVPYSLGNTTLDPSEVLSSSGWITLQDVVNSGGDLPLALASAITSNETFLANISDVEVTFGPAIKPSEGDCNPWELVHLGTFKVFSHGFPTAAGGMESQNKAETATVCFDPFVLNGSYEVQVIEL